MIITPRACIHRKNFPTAQVLGGRVRVPTAQVLGGRVRVGFGGRVKVRVYPTAQVLGVGLGLGFILPLRFLGSG